MDKKNVFKEPGISLDQLRSKQSVRTTFKLPEEVINLLSLIAGQLGIKQKSLLDQLTEDAAILNKMAQSVQKTQQRSVARQQKTFVMSKSALHAINEAARRQNIPRDLLLEISIRRLLPVIDEEQEKHQKRKQIIAEMYAQLQHLEDLHSQAALLLGESDDFHMMLSSQVLLARKNLRYAQALIEKGQELEQW